MQAADPDAKGGANRQSLREARLGYQSRHAATLGHTQEVMHKLTVDWTTIHSLEEFWDLVCREGEEPEWHGRNLAALEDSWVTGDINPTGPPYEFSFVSCDRVREPLRGFAEAVMEIARRSVKENGGSVSSK